MVQHAILKMTTLSRRKEETAGEGGWDRNIYVMSLIAQLSKIFPEDIHFSCLCELLQKGMECGIVSHKMLQRSDPQLYTALLCFLQEAMLV